MTKGRFWGVVLAGLIGGLALIPQTGLAKTGCQVLRAACEAAGFSANGGQSQGLKIVPDCMNPLMSGVEPPGNSALALPLVAKDALAECSAARAKRGKAKTASTIARAEGNAPTLALPLPEGHEAGPNIVMILVDDFSMNLMPDDLGALAEVMPNLARMRRDGMTFDRYFVTDSLCCPSRASIFTGKMPHNTGVLTNSPPDGGLAAFMQHNNDAHTFAVALHESFYATAMMGKYLNGYMAEASGIPQGWSEWAVAGHAYPNFNYTFNHNGVIETSDLHMTDQLSQMGQDFIAASADRPFFLELSTYSPHAPYTPPARYAEAFPDVTYPRTPAFAARPDDHAPSWLQKIPPLERRFQKKIDEIYRMRVQSAKGIDDMIGAIRSTLEDLGLEKDTYVIFTSDNGYHLGEFSLRAGKMSPFDTDIHVPLVVVGPDVPAGSRNGDIAMNIDLYPTFLDLAGLPATPEVDGQSLVTALQGGQGPGRNLAVIEHRQTDRSPDDPDASDPKAGDPPTYVALRLKDAMFVTYQDGSGEVGYYDMTNDPHQLSNIAHTLPKARLQALLAAAKANHECKGAVECLAAQSLQP